MPSHSRLLPALIFVSINDKEAIKYAQQLITHHPRNPYGYSRHAQALLKQKQPFNANQIALSG
jgi:hypothetical protein